MFSFLKNDPGKDETTFLVCSLDSYAVSAAVVRLFLHEGSVPRPVVLFSCEEKVPAYHDGDLGLLDEAVVAAAGRVLAQCRSFQGRVDRLFCGVGEPWVTTLSRSAHLERGEPFRALQKTVDDVMVRENRMAEQDILRTFADAEEVGIIDISRPTTLVNGYPADGRLDIMARSLDVHFAVSVAPVAFVNALVGAYADTFHRTDVTFLSAEIARTLVAPREGTATVLAIGGITSTLSLVKKGQVSYTVSVAGGMADLERDLGSLFDVRASRLDSVMRFASDEKMLGRDRDQYFVRIRESYRELGDTLRRAVFSLQRHTQSLPGPAYVLADREWVTRLESVLSEDLGIPASAVPDNFFEERLVLTRDARARSSSLMLSVLRAASLLPPGKKAASS